MNIVKRLATRMKDEKQRAAANRAAKFEEYRRLLGRLSNLKTGEEKRLEELVLQLEIDPAHVEAHAAILVAYDAAEKSGASVEAVHTEIAAEAVRRAGLYQQLATITVEIRKSEGKNDTLLAQFGAAETARDDVAKFQRWFGGLLLGTDTSGDRGDLPRALIDNPELREQLGIVQDTPWERGRLATADDVARAKRDRNEKMAGMKNRLGKDQARLEERTRARNFMETNPDAREAYEVARQEVEQLEQSVKKQAARIAEAEAA